MKTYILILSFIFLAIGIFLNTRLINSTQAYKTAKEEYALGLNYKERFFDKDEWLSTDKKNPKLELAKQRLLQIESIQSTNNVRLNMVLGFCLIYLLWIIGFYVMGRSIPELVFQLSILSLVCLHAGLFIPMLEIAAFERNLDLGEIPISTNIMGMNVNFNFEKQFDGDIYFYYQSKSVVELIRLLFQQHNFIVAISILIFSVLFPVVKTGLTILASFKPNLVNANWYKNFVLNLGKWSMADVFVVAVFLSFLAFQNMQVGINTQSNVLMGLYFFMTYCFLSISISMLVSKLQISDKEQINLDH